MLTIPIVGGKKSLISMVQKIDMVGLDQGNYAQVSPELEPIVINNTFALESPVV
jgi:translation elongation factor EF-1alpha